MSSKLLLPRPGTEDYAKKAVAEGFIVRKTLDFKAVDTEKKSVTSYVSTYQWDRMEERFAKGAWRLDNYRKDPVVLWVHNSGFMDPATALPIGRNESLIEDEYGLLAETTFHDLTELAKTVFALIEARFLHAFSVGFRPFAYAMEEIEGTGRKGLVWKDAELVEYSVVPVPANPGAVIGRELGELAVKAFGGSISLVEKSGGVILEPKKPEFFDSLKGLVDLAKSVKGTSFDQDKLTLLQTALSVFHEIVQERTIGMVTPEQIEQLSKIVQEYATVVKSFPEPDVEEIVSKVLMQIDSARRGGKRA